MNQSGCCWQLSLIVLEIFKSKRTFSSQQNATSRSMIPITFLKPWNGNYWFQLQHLRRSTLKTTYYASNTRSASALDSSNHHPSKTKGRRINKTAIVMSTSLLLLVHGRVLLFLLMTTMTPWRWKTPTLSTLRTTVPLKPKVSSTPVITAAPSAVTIEYVYHNSTLID